MPGETYQTLKFKATQQAKKSGMSQSAAENYGSVMATNAAVQGGATGSPDFLGSNKTQKRATQAEILGNITQTTTGVAEERKEAEKKKQVIYPEREKKKKKTKTFMQTIMGGGVGGDLSVEKEDFEAPGKHKARVMHDYMLAKYGKGWLDTTQGQDSIHQLHGIAASKGGGRGLLDASILDKIPEIRDKYLLGDPKDMTIDMLKTKNFPVAEIRDQPELGRHGPLTSDEYFKVTQMLFNKYPEKYKKARPWASGAAIPAIGKALISPMATVGTGILNALTGKKEKKLDPIFTGEPLDPKLFYDLDNIEQSGLMGTEVAMNAQNDIDYNDPDDPDDDPPPGYDSWGEFYAASGIVEGTGGFGADGQYYFNYADGGIASLDNGQFDTAEADSLMFRDPVEDDEWEYNV